MNKKIDIKKVLSRTQRLGINKPVDLLFLMPKNIKDYTKFENFSSLNDGDKGFFKLKALSMPKIFKSNSGFFIFVTDGVTNFNLMVFGQNYDYKDIKVNEFFYCFGQVKFYNDGYMLINENRVSTFKVGKVFPEYKKIPKIITSDSVHEKIKSVFDLYIDEAILLIIKNCNCENENDVIKNTNLPFNNLKSFFKALHFPNNRKEYDNAIESCERLSSYEIVSISNNVKKEEVKNSIIEKNDNYIDSLINRLPYPLTNDQYKCIYEIINDLNSPFPMNRLLSGDVGTGKTVTYMIPAIMALKNNKRVAIIIQSFLVASQVAKEINNYFPEIKIVFKAGKLKKKEMEQTEKEMDEGNCIVIGTSSIIHSMYDFKNSKFKKDYAFDLLIIDEEHKLGTEQKEILSMDHTNVLKATATAIPRTLALVTHGGVDISFLRDKPVKKEIETMVWTSEKQKDMLKLVESVVESGNQCAIVYPVAKNKDEDDIYEDEPDIQYENRKITKNVEEAAEMLEKFFPNNISYIHGKMKDDEKTKIINELKENKKQILVASSVIEIGVTLPSMMLVAVMDADLHGVTTLHQLRGRIDRNGKITASGKKGHFVMMVRRKPTEKIMTRLNILVDSDDGFKVAEDDMLQRGFGEIAGVRQSGSTSSVFIGIKLKPSDINDFIEKIKKENESKNNNGK